MAVHIPSVTWRLIVQQLFIECKGEGFSRVNWLSQAGLAIEDALAGQRTGYYFTP